MVKRARHNTLTGFHLLSGPLSAGSNDGMSVHTPGSGNNSGTSSIALAGLLAWPTPTALDPMLGMASASGGIELSATALPHPSTHAHIHARPPMGGGVGVGAGSKSSSSASVFSVGAGAVPRRTSSQPSLSSSASLCACVIDKLALAPFNISSSSARTVHVPNSLSIP
ncbi:hypothetical protein JVU11DRAFT_9318 [Chiua virens]|nr:hypothetical protein JVU11DRAFT_9318 [Chiua virens]